MARVTCWPQSWRIEDVRDVIGHRTVRVVQHGRAAAAPPLANDPGSRGGLRAVWRRAARARHHEQTPQPAISRTAPIRRAAGMTGAPQSCGDEYLDLCVSVQKLVRSPGWALLSGA
jgi:hypothetical protein